MKRLLLYLCILFAGQSLAQHFTWTEIRKYPIEAEGVWSVDGLENVYISQYGLINKYDSLGALKFTQSIKSLGSMTQLVSINPMKLIHFSEEQQTLCYLDNTLSPLDDCLDLTEEEIVNAVMISESAQPNKLWVLDNLNSRLLLLALDKVYQPQSLNNLRGVLDLNQVTHFAERNNQLILLDATKGVYLFDLYGTLLEHFPAQDILDIDANEQTLFCLHSNRMSIRSFASGETLDIDLPVQGVIDFAFRNHFFFLRTKNAVYKFTVQFSE